jgi:caa(3)-type oxidase subunit IV
MNPAIKRFALVWLALLGLLFATRALARFDLKGFNSFVALGISLAKMLLVFAYFMELRSSPRTLWIIAGAGLLWLVIFFDLTLSDYLTRGYLGSQ